MDGLPNAWDRYGYMGGFDFTEILEELCDNYESFISKANKELGDSIDATYGVKGIVAIIWANEILPS